VGLILCAALHPLPTRHDLPAPACRDLPTDYAPWSTYCLRAAACPRHPESGPRGQAAGRWQYE